ncbi:MAG: helix-turn-helix domain-containing protein [Prevotella sp.]|nr:helix-turn-helix domain-containing protein [Prevotella sp.]
MNKFEILSEALDFIEENLTSDVTPEMCADRCRYSLSNMQKMFRCVFHIGIGDYISRRRLTRAARDLLETEDTVLDVALKYGYNSHEVFTRAFIRLWNVSPAKFRRERKFSEIFPKLTEPRTVTDERGNIVMTSEKRFDVSHLYDFIRERRGKYAVCFDIVGLMYINETYGRPAGDAAIAECLRRLDEAAGDSMLPIRIGGDEFVLITDFSDVKQAEAAAERVLAFNGNTITSGGSAIPVSLRAGCVAIPDNGNIRYNELFDSFIIVAGRAGR